MINKAELSNDNPTPLRSEVSEEATQPIAYLRVAGDNSVEISTAGDSSLPTDDPANTTENT